MSRIVIADDHAFFRSGLEASLVTRGHEIVASVGDGEAAIAAVADKKPDVVIIDLRMPGCGGVETVEAIRKKGFSGPIIIFATEVDDASLLKLFRLGVEAVLQKHGAEGQIFAAIDLAATGLRMIDRDLMDRALALLDDQPPAPSLDNLSPKEMRIAELVTKGLTNREIGAALKTTEGAIKTYLHLIFQKTRSKNRSSLSREYLKYKGTLEDAS